MPLVLLVGQPLRDRRDCAGALLELARSRGVDAMVIDDALLGCQPADVVDAIGTLRTRLRQTVVQYLSPSRLVIVDHTNHTKSFRYELHCVAKEKRTSNCTVTCTLGPPLTPERYLELGLPGLSYEKYVDVCLRFEPLLAGVKADQPSFGPDQLEAVLDYAYGGKRAQTQGIQKASSSSPGPMTEVSRTVPSSLRADPSALTLSVIETIFAIQAASALSDASLQVREGLRLSLPHRSISMGELHRLRHDFLRSRGGKGEGEDVGAAFCEHLEAALHLTCQGRCRRS
ncbi:Chromatin associated protein KTI12 [Giardia muris]|uniref:Chromatin associated protein KTI12 n=1 Tax=Giardia muris TaxID=5742 RepID=A0A4Z1SL26_GIAMU|nr:Chromatin associated protein KTI12 [Giardia muris]|eukprot:TNJ26354.1 Chromatin associated protein KTI12 [Giardia muris]